jgi:hypothetical protein
MPLPPGGPGHHANRLRAELRRRRYTQERSITSVDLAKIALRTGDVDLAATAIIMWPRPCWVAGIIGPGELPDLELLHPDDVATDGQW